MQEFKFLKNIIHGNVDYKVFNSEYENFNYYEKNKEELLNSNIVPYSVEEIIDLIKSSKIKDLFLESISDFNIDKLYKSYIHGLNHNIRVLIYVFLISSIEKIGNRDVQILFEAAKYHDIGRINDNEDKTHGIRSADNLVFLKDKYSDEELSYLKTIITAHSMNDIEFENIAIQNNIIDIDRCRRMFEILKDSDGLDRVRLEYPYIKIDFLRTMTAKKLVLFAYILYYNYELYLREKVETNE